MFSEKDIKAYKEKLYLTNKEGFTYQNPEARLSPEEVAHAGEKLGIRTDVHRTCVNCQIRQLMKYKDVGSEKYPANEFHVPCSYIAKNLPAGSAEALARMTAESDMTRERALLILKSTVDPVAWAELMFGFSDEYDGRGGRQNWRLRPYQKEQLRCTSLRTVVRAGRRVGKTFSAALKLLNYVFNLEVSHGVDQKGNPVIMGPEIMVVTPYQSQINGLFNEMEMLLKRSADLKRQVTSGTGGNLYVKTPFFKMEFSNGAKIKGFVSGVGNKTDGSGGGTIRGQSCHVIYLDEMDMIPDDVLEKVVMPILLTTDSVRLMATSTPIGKRGKFYNWALENVLYKEDYLPSSVLPQWEELADQLRADNNIDSFNAEYMAHFIESSFGVFKPSYVYAARQDYTYFDSDRNNMSWWREFAGVRETSQLVYLIGIDWNKNAGTEFVVIAYDPGQHHWYVCEATNVAASEFSAENWKAEVMRLNYKWKPEFIYADEGYGHTIIDDLKLHSQQVFMKENHKKTKMDFETEKLKERLVGFNFSSKVELTSPLDGQKFSKSGKEFLVENAVRIFESQRIWYSVEDKTMLKQLVNYVVLRRSQTTNKPIYGPDNHEIGDHRLDALILALGGFTLELGLYNGSSMGISEPGSVSKDELRSRMGENTDARVEHFKKMGLVEMFNIEGMGKPQPIPGRDSEKRGRGDIGGQKPVFDQMFERATFSPSSSQIDYDNMGTSGDIVSRVSKRSRSGGRSDLSKRRR